jgi:hypothetical protein
MAKRINVSEHKAFRVEGVKYDKDTKMVSIRQLYNTQKDPTFKPGRQGVALPLEVAERVAKAILSVVEEGKFKQLEKDK